MDKEEPNFNIWGEISDSNMVLEAAKVEQNTKNNKKNVTSGAWFSEKLRRKLKINACGFVVPLEFGTFYDVISMVYKSVNHGKLWSFC